MLKNERGNLKTRLYLFLFFLVVGSICCLSIVTYWKSVQEQRRKFSEQNQQLLEQLAGNLDGYFDDLLRLSVVPAYNKQLISLLEQEPGKTPLDHLEKQRTIEDFLDTMMVYPRKDILTVFLIADQVYYGSRYRPGFDNTLTLSQMEEELLTSLSREGSAIFLGPYASTAASSPAGERVSVLNAVRSAGPSQEILALIRVDADFSAINRTCSRIYIGQNSGLVILDNARRLAYSSLPDSLSSMLPDALGQLNDTDTLRLDGEEYLINQAGISKPGWTAYTVTSFRDINADAGSTRNLMFISAFILAVAALVTIIFFLQRFLAPLYEIMDRVQEVGKGNFDVRFPDARTDEVGMLGRSMNGVVSRLDRIMRENASLENRVLQSQLIEKEAQVNMLYSQIQPHFIYNTLNMISMSMQMGHGDEAIELLYKLSKFMRSMSKSDALHSVGAELRLLCDYLDIQKKRYGKRLDYMLEQSGEISGIMVPVLILQPIVENAIVHGCEQGWNRILIRITATLADGELRVSIEDNGPGIGEERLALLREKMELPASENVEAVFSEGGAGLRNVNRRLKIRCGDEYGLHIESRPGRGTTVVVRIPLESEQKGGDADVSDFNRG